jgi:glucokinase
MTIVLAGDIGGTKTILRLLKIEDRGINRETIHEAKYPSQDYPDLVPMIWEFLANIEHKTPDNACFAIAGPVIDRASNLTNLNWDLDEERLQNELNIAKVSLINDFAAVSYGILGLNATETHTLQTGKKLPRNPIAVLGAGTGLGESFLVPQGDAYQVFATEGGHVDFAPLSELEFQLVEDIKQRLRLDRVSAERVISGRGIVNIYQFLRDRDPNSENPTIGKNIRLWEEEAVNDRDKTIDPAAIISQAALAGTDALCLQTMQIFVSAYGAEAGNFALKLLPYGGVYLAGGIAAKIIPLLQQDDRFLSAFQAKGRMKGIMQNIPVQIVLNPQVGLLGSILYLFDSYSN